MAGDPHIKHEFGCPKEDVDVFGNPKSFDPCKCSDLRLGRVLTDCERTEADRLADITVSLAPTIENPFPVYDDHGKLLGSAVVSLAGGPQPGGAFHLRFILDPHHPESFDLTNEPDRCRVKMDASLSGGVLRGTVVLTSK